MFTDPGLRRKFEKRASHLRRRTVLRHKHRETTTTTNQISGLERICWTCGLCFDTAEELVEHRRVPEFKYIHDRKYVAEFHGSTSFHQCNWCWMCFTSNAGRYSHEMTDLIHWQNMVQGYKYEGLVAVNCKRCTEIVSTSRWGDHERFSPEHNCCHVCELDFPYVQALRGHIEKFRDDGAHDWVCRNRECMTVCRSENELENHCSAWAKHRGDLCDEHASFQCGYCRKILGTFPLWKEHTKAAHLDLIQEYELLVEKEDGGGLEQEAWKWYSVVIQG